MGSGWKQTGNDPLFAPLAIRSVATACIKASYLFSPLFPHHPQSSSFARVVFEVDRQPANHPFTRSPATTTCNLRMNGWRNRHKRLDRVLTQGHGLYQADGIVRLKAAWHCHRNETQSLLMMVFYAQPFFAPRHNAPQAATERAFCSAIAASE